MGFNIDMQTVQKSFKDGFEIASQKGREGLNFASQKGREGLNFAAQKGGEWLKKAIEILKIGSDRATPYLQKYWIAAATAYFCASLIIIDLSIRLGSRISKTVSEDRAFLRQRVDTSSIIICGALLFAPLIMYVNRANLPLSWFSMSTLALIAFGARGAFESDSGIRV